MGSRAEKFGSTNKTDLNHRGALVKLASAAMVNGVAEAVTWNDVEYDTSSIYDAGSKTRLTVPAGITKVRLTANLNLGSRSDYNSIFLIIKKNNTTTIGLPSSFTDNAGVVSIPFTGNLTSSVISVTPGDYFELWATQVNTAAAAVGIDTAVSWFAMEIIE